MAHPASKPASSKHDLNNLLMLALENVRLAQHLIADGGNHADLSPRLNAAVSALERLSDLVAGRWGQTQQTRSSAADSAHTGVAGASPGVDDASLRLMKPSPSAPQPASPLRLLIVDDDRPFLDVASAALTLMNTRVKTCANLQEVCKELRGTCFDAVICDQNLETTTAIEVLAALRSSNSRDAIFVLMTGDSLRDDVIRTQESFDFKVFQKPFSFTDIVTYIQLHASRSRLSLGELALARGSDDA